MCIILLLREFNWQTFRSLEPLTYKRILFLLIFNSRDATLFRPTNSSFISWRKHLRHLAPYSRSSSFELRHPSPRHRLTVCRPSISRVFSNTPYVYTHVRMYIYRWLIESKGRGRYKVCRPPRHETHALPLERRRRRTSLCSNVHLVPVDTPTLSASNGPRKKRTSVRRLCRREGNIGDPTEGSALLHLVDGYEEIIVCAFFQNPFFSSSDLPPALPHRVSFGLNTVSLLCQFIVDCSLFFV